ncbi:hypothetical protein [Enemella sp. A6]|uniref:hypothetical protein n=1 Tax=Enemella sp. A6 TaxID=3440152 RepID=UPI003EC05835
MSTRIRTGALVAAALMTITACTGDDPEPAREPTPSATSSEPSAEPTAPPTPTPAPSISGELTGEVFPEQVGSFKPKPAEAHEGEFNPNETPYYALEPGQAAEEALRPCTDDVPAYTDPTHALGAYYADEEGAPGRALVFQFRTAEDAAGYFKVLSTLVTGCAAQNNPQLKVEDVVRDQDTITSRSTFDEQDKWSELIIRQDNRVAMMILNDGHTLSRDELLTVRDRLGR